VLAAPLLGAVQLAGAAGTHADTAITNTATATYDDGTGTQTVSSNPATIRVDEVLDVTVTSNDSANIPVTTPDVDDVLGFTVTNIGNGPEAFRLVSDPGLGGDDYDPTNNRIYLDTNGNGLFEPGTDPLYVFGVNDPLLAADDSIVVFVVHDTPPLLANGAVGLADLDATAATGSGLPGTSFPGQGTGGTDAVVGASTASDAEQGGYVVANVVAALVKSQVVADPFGGTNAIPGAVITYTLVLTISGSGSISNTLIADAIPSFTTYVPASIRLDGSPQTDAVDGDAGRFTGGGIEVDLGVLAAPDSVTIEFQVVIN
jgi:uncharacterized repeat protein (TIGR01451 family)